MYTDLIIHQKEGLSKNMSNFVNRDIFRGNIFMASRSRRKKETELIEGVFGLVVIASLFLGFSATKSLIGTALITGCVLGLSVVVLIVIRMQQQEKLKKSGIHEIDKMDGIQFEHYLKLLLSSKGYKVEVTRASGDYGADLVLCKGSKKIVVQAKRYSKRVGIKAIQEVVGSKAHYKAEEAWVITNNYFTDAALNLAKSNGVRLINRDQLIQMILQMNPNAIPNPQKIMAKVKTEKKVCNRCGKEMVLRKGPKGQFYGCSGFPKCRNTKPVGKAASV